MAHELMVEVDLSSVGVAGTSGGVAAELNDVDGEVGRVVNFLVVVVVVAAEFSGRAEIVNDKSS